MIPRRIYLNLGAFVVLFALLAFWAASNVIRPDFLRDSYRVDARFAEATGLRPGVEVTFLGVRVGEVDEVTLLRGAADVHLGIDAGRALPLGASAAVRRRSAVGEPYVAIDPPANWAAGDPSLPTEGGVIGIDSTSLPVAYGDLFDSADAVLGSVDREDMNTVVSELAVALRGRGAALRAVIGNTSDVASTFADGGAELDRLAGELTTLTRTLADTSPTIAESTDDLTTLVESLSSSADDIEALVDRAPSMLTQVSDIVEASYFDLECGLEASGTIASLAGSEETISQIVRLLRAAPAAAAIIPLGVYDGPDGRYLAGTFGFAPGELVEYPVFPEFEAPPAMPTCPDGSPPLPPGLEGSTADAAVDDADQGDTAAPPVAAVPGAPDADERSSAADDHGDDAFPWLLVLAAVLATLGAGAGAVTAARTRPRSTR